MWSAADDNATMPEMQSGKCQQESDRREQLELRRPTTTTVKSCHASSQTEPQYLTTTTPFQILRRTPPQTSTKPVRNNNIPTLQQRWQNYEAARQRIFNSTIDNNNNRINNKIISAINTYNSQDNRVFIDVDVEGVTVKGLLDSGASVSLLGRNYEQILRRIRQKPDAYTANILTASGAPHQIVGKISVKVRYRNISKNMTFYICPSLTQEAYLGVDFWKIFRLAPEVMGVAALETPTIEKAAEDENAVPLTPEQQQRLNEVVDQFLTFEKNGLSTTPVMKHKIELIPDAKPYKERHYPVSPAVQNLIYAEVDEMLRLKVIEECESPWNNRVTLVRKPGKNRLCLDARKLNALTVKDAYPLPIIEGILGRLDQTHVISSIDLKHAFWQIELDEESRNYTAITIPGRPLYRYRVMPFGLCNAAQRLCRLMDIVIPHELRENVFVYLDDLLVISRNVDEHLVLLEKVATCLRKADLTIGRKKSKFCCKQVCYLGYIVGGGNLRTNPDKVQAIKNLPEPKSIREVRSFLGTAGWYRRFINNFASLAAPLTDATKKSGKKFVLSKEAKEAFEKLKAALTEAPVLVHPDFAKHFYLQCDASDTGIGAVLYQKDAENNEKPIAYFSQKLNSAQKNYYVTEKECLAAVMAFKKFRPYIEMHPFTIRTDHASIQWLMDQKDLSGRLARWAIQLQSYDFNIEHVAGKNNVVADTLSRSIAALGLSNDILSSVKNAIDDEYTDLIKNVQANDTLTDVKIVDQVVYKKVNSSNIDEEHEWKLWVPGVLTTQLIKEAHEHPTAVHCGIAKTLQSLRRFYFWPKMSTQVHEIIARCEICKETKQSNRVSKPMMGAEIYTTRPFQRLYIDFMGKYPRSNRGNTYLFVVLDHFTKFVFLKPMRNATSVGVCKFLIQNIFHAYGVPEAIHSDNGKQFVSKEFAAMLENYEIKHIKTAVYSPQANAAERVNQSVLAAIRTYVGEDHTNWDLHMSEIECALRSSWHSTIRMSPYFAAFGQNMFLSGQDYDMARKLSALEEPRMEPLKREDALETLRKNLMVHLHQAHLKNEKRYNKTSRVIQYQPGQEIYKKNFHLSNFAKNINAKFKNKYTKCRVVKAVGNCLYELETLKGKRIGIFHAKDLKQ